MEENCEVRKWDKLLPDVLALIFKNLPLQEVLTVVPAVCKSWEAVVSGPYCWKEIDIEEWSRNSDAIAVGRMLRLLVTRSCGSVRKLSVSYAGKESFDFIANNAQSLHTLKLPRSMINEETIEATAPKLSSVTNLDLSYCVNLGARALSALGKSCKALTSFRREMYPFGNSSRNEEAVAIASTMPRLKHLDLQYLSVGTSSVMGILKSCEDLEFLDVRGCLDVVLEKRSLKEYPKLRVLGTIIDGSDATGWDCSPSSGDYLVWDFVADEADEHDEELEDYESDNDDDNDDDDDL